MRTLALVLVLLSTGCVADGPQRRTPRQPDGVLPAKLVPTASVEFVDTDANRYRDSATVVVYVIGDNPGFQIPIRTEGVFELGLEDPSGRRLATWNFDKAMTAAALATLQPGPGFVFNLDIRKSSTGKDAIDIPEATLVVSLTPAKGEVIRARTSAPILIGPVGHGRR